METKPFSSEMVNMGGRRVFTVKTSMGDTLGDGHSSSSTAVLHGNIAQLFTESLKKRIKHCKFEARTTWFSYLPAAKGMENWMVTKATTVKQRQDCLVEQALPNCVCVLYCKHLVFRDMAMTTASILWWQGIVTTISKNLKAETRD